MAQDFRKYEHLERLGHVEVSGITEGTVYVFPKLDGTNASVWMDATETGSVQCGSRNHRLTLDGDNAGFCAWVNTVGAYTDGAYERPAKLAELFGQNPHWTLYGEWLVPHTIKTYRPEAWRRFWVFDVYDRGQQRYVPYDEYLPVLQAAGLDIVPPLAIVNNALEADLRLLALANTFQMQDGAGPGEGIVIKNYAWRNVHGCQTWAKIVRNEFKEQNAAAFGLKERDGSFDLERTIAEKYVTPTLVAKELAKITLDLADAPTDPNADPRRQRGKILIPRLLGTVWYSLIREELWDAIKEHRDPTIDFKRLKRHALAVTKRLSPELFGGEPVCDSAPSST